MDVVAKSEYLQACVWGSLKRAGQAFSAQGFDVETFKRNHQ